MAVTAPFQFARIPRAVWFPEWGHLVSHDVPFKDGYSGTIEIEIEAMTPLLIGGERRAPKKAKNRRDNPQTDEEKNGKEGEVWPVRLPDDTYAIPGSSLQGMIRNILEIACFGKLGPWVDQRRFGIRDISGRATGTAAYSSRMNHRNGNGTIVPDVKAGWLRREGSKFYLMKCEMARIDYHDLQPLSSATLNPPPLPPNDKNNRVAMNKFKKDYKAAKTWKKKSDVTERYAWLKTHDVYFTLSSEKTHDHRGETISIQYNLVDDAKLAPFTNCKSGKIILTGNASDPPRHVGDPHKHMEFIFYDEQDEHELGADFAARFEEFVEIHEPTDGRPKNSNWSYYRGTGYTGMNGWMPIFYLANPSDESRIESFGLAFMFKLAHKNETHDMLMSSSPCHLDRHGYDLASLIFGGVGDETENSSYSHSLKRRVSFDWAVASLPTDKKVETGTAIGADGKKVKRNAILLGPKPSYYPIYVRQPNPLNSLYATHTPAKRRKDGDNHDHNDLDDEAVTRWWPELSGTKIWPNTGASLLDNMPALPVRADNNKSVQNQLNALPAGTQFEKTKLHIHNLRQIELNALLWALTFGDANAISELPGQFGKRHHRFGMGKPLGLGEVKIAVRKIDLMANDDPERSVTLEDAKNFVDDAHFGNTMNDICESLATKSDPVQTWQWFGNEDAEGTKSVSWRETSQVKALLEAAKPNPAQPLGYMALGKDRVQGTYVGERALEQSLSSYSDGWELTTTHNPADIPFADPLPKPPIAQNPRQGHNRDQTN